MFEVAIESLEEIWDEMLPLMEWHFEEVHPNDTFLPDQASYFSLEAIGALKLYTLRDEGNLIGYVGFSLMPNMHSIMYKKAVCDAIYLLREYRGTNLIHELLDLVELDLYKESVNHISINMPYGSQHANLFEQRDYVPLEVVFQKKVR